MRKVLFALFPLLSAAPAFAVDVGDIVRVDRSQFKCEEVTPPPCHPHGYSYCDSVDGSSYGSVTLSGSVLGLGDLGTAVTSCSALNALLDAAGNPVPLEVTKVSAEKFANRKIQYITLSLGSGDNRVQFEGSKDL
jgi:hypothetical protein